MSEATTTATSSAIGVTDDAVRADATGAATSTPTPELLAELAEADARLETAPASAIIGWALERFGQSIVLAASFQDVVLIDLATRARPDLEVVFLDTGAHFPETLAFVDEVTARYGLNLTVTHPGPEAEAWPCGTARCCQLRKVEPLKAAVTGRQAWMTALKRVDATTRAEAPIVSWDHSFGLVKLNPMAAWTDDDIASYLADHELPVHPLVPLGYLSIGCAPTTRPVAEGEDPRAGRWAGAGKTECGLHA